MSKKTTAPKKTHKPKKPTPTPPPTSAPPTSLVWESDPCAGFDTYLVIEEDTLKYWGSVTRQKGQTMYEAYFCDGRIKQAENFDNLVAAQQFVEGFAKAE